MLRCKKIFFSVILLFGLVLSACNIEIVASYDVIIFGAGVSSLTAAIDLADSGKKVLIVEESGIVGGNKRLLTSGVSILDPVTDTAASFKNDIIENNNGKENFYVNHLVRSAETIPAWLKSNNVMLENKIQLPGNSVARTLAAKNGEHTGNKIVLDLEKAAKAKQVKIAYNSKIEKIMPKNDAGVYALNIEDRTTIVTVNTKTIVFGEDFSTFYDSVVPITDRQQIIEFKGKTTIDSSTGMKLLQTMGGDFSKTGELNLLDNFNYSNSQPISPALRTHGAMLVNREGKRFINEMSNIQLVAKEIMNQPGGMAYLIFDDVVLENMEYLKKSYSKQTTTEAQSITDLSVALAINETSLQRTIAEYKDYAFMKNDLAFNRPFEANMPAFAQAGTNGKAYYAIAVQPIINVRSTYAKVSDKFEVIKDNVPMEGIYAVGDSAAGIQLTTTLYGTELTYAITMGRDVAISINEFLQ
ncbi:MAG: FAD-binding protein [Culicoidibacterales bacterium]